MAISDKDFIVAIELGSSKIAGIAGKKKDGEGTPEKNGAEEVPSIVFVFFKTF